MDMGVSTSSGGEVYWIRCFQRTLQDKYSNNSNAWMTSGLFLPSLAVKVNAAKRNILLFVGKYPTHLKNTISLSNVKVVLLR
jgi:hypothetical protein